MPAEHRARKRFGQNFLIDMGVVDAIADAVAPRAGDHLVEIGPGLAALTRALLERMSPDSLPLQVIEIDRDLVARLQRTFSSDQLHIHAGDVLTMDFVALAAAAGGGLRIVGNLPYNISSPLLFLLADAADHIVDQHFMLQREVVARMTASPGSADFSRLSVMLQYRYAMDHVLDVPPEAFDPPPKVHSAVVRMVPRAASALDAIDTAVLGEVVGAGFSQRRKMLRNTLAPILRETEGDSAGIALTARAEDVPVAAWVQLANRLVEARRARA